MVQRSKQPDGRALRWTPAQIERLARISPDDERAAAELWRVANAGTPERELLDAEADTEGRR